MASLKKVLQLAQLTAIQRWLVKNCVYCSEIDLINGLSLCEVIYALLRIDLLERGKEDMIRKRGDEARWQEFD